MKDTVDLFLKSKNLMETSYNVKRQHATECVTFLLSECILFMVQLLLIFVGLQCNLKNHEKDHKQNLFFLYFSRSKDFKFCF